MADNAAHEVWKKILVVLDEKMQFAFLEQARSVVDVRLNGPELTLVLGSDESYRFFSSEVNQQRLIIVSRGIHPLQTFRIEKVEATSI